MATARRLDQLALLADGLLNVAEGGGTVAGETLWGHQTAMQVHDALAAGALMQVVDVLRDHGDLASAASQAGDRVVRGIGLGLQHLLATPQVPAPDQGRVRAKGLGRFQALRIVASPQAGQLIAERRDAAFSGDPRAGEYHDMARLPQGGGGCGESVDQKLVSSAVALLKPGLGAARPTHTGDSWAG